jgi:glycosyltransferase involved in cell wall biosynthesis
VKSGESELPPQLGIVSPVYKAEGCIEELHRRLTAVLQGMQVDYEIILVDDGSPDRSGVKLEQIALADPNVTAVILSRNFGQHAAILAGLSESTASAVVVMDCDLQDRPEDIPLLYAKLLEGFDVAIARRHERQDSWFKRTTSRIWFGILNRLTDSPTDREAGSFSVVTRQVVDELLSMPNRHSHFLFILKWLGFRQIYVDVQHNQRFAGKSSYSVWSLFAHALAGITAHSTRLLHLSIYAGFSFFALAVVQFAYVIFRKLADGIGVEGWASVMAAIWLMGGAILFSLGVIGIYIGRIVEDVKGRPPFVVRRRIRAEAP